MILRCIVTLTILLVVTPAMAHEWFPPTCCTSRDCFEIVPGRDIEIVPGGYHIRASGEFISMEKTRETPPEGRGHWARCTRGGDPSKPTLGNNATGYGGDPRACLYVPPARF